MKDSDYIKATARTDLDREGYSEVRGRMAEQSEIIHYAMGMVTEAGEILDAVKKHVIYGKDLDEVNLMEEIGDMEWYISRMLDHLGVSYEEIRDLNVRKLKHRFPEGFTEGNAVKRDLKGEREILESKG